MAYEHKDDSGSLFKNDNRAKDTDPWYKGSGKIDGKEMWINAWVNEAANGKKYMSLKFSPKEAKTNIQPDDLSDQEIPF